MQYFNEKIILRKESAKGTDGTFRVYEVTNEGEFSRLRCIEFTGPMAIEKIIPPFDSKSREIVLRKFTEYWNAWEI